jgi:hypothetical protein
MPSYKHLVLGLAAAAVMLTPLSAAASVRDTVNSLLDQVAHIAHPDAVAPVQPVAEHADPQVIAPQSDLTPAALPEFNMPSLPSVAVDELPTPSVETPLKKLFCVEYARARSGLAVFGDAKFWWTRAKTLYARAADPVENAVMVFSASRRLRLGHVAVVTNIVSRREIRVDQANWQNHGEIDHSTPVLDVSAKNDWSQVRVWDMNSGGFGAHVYAVSGFIAKELSRQASN